MSTLGKFCLKWDDFLHNVTSEFGLLRSDGDFSDVTLACEDGQQFEAHKIILAAASPFFQKLLRSNKHPHPLIYLKGVRAEDLVAIIHFVYFGETSVIEENLADFLAVAEELKVKGLIEGNTKRKENEKQPKTKTKIENQKLTPIKREVELNEELTAQEPFDEKIVGVKTLISNEDLQEIDKLVEPMLIKSESNLAGKTTACKECGKEGARSHIKDHVEAKHIEGIALPCAKCGMIFGSRAALRVHRRKHT
jgi:hypothetical protein